EYISPITRYYMDHFDAQLSILSDVNTKALSGIDPARMARAQGSRRELLKTFMQRDADGSLRWSVAMYPTDAYAQDAEMSVDALADFILRASLGDEADPVAAWRAVAVRQQPMIDRLAGNGQHRSLGHESDL